MREPVSQHLEGRVLTAHCLGALLGFICAQCCTVSQVPEFFFDRLANSRARFFGAFRGPRLDEEVSEKVDVCRLEGDDDTGKSASPGARHNRPDSP